jgi:phenylpyruvate tautomerase PptA (4-oxalocrotonate tautomerase family)
MPLVQIRIYAGKTETHRRALLDGVQMAIVEALEIPGPNVFEVLHEMKTGDFRRTGWSSENFTLVEITLFPGRDAEAKKCLYRAIADNLAKSPGIGGKDIIIMLRESLPGDWSVRDGLPASETGVPR